MQNKFQFYAKSFANLYEKVNIIIHMQFCFTYNLRNSQIVLGQVYALSGILY